MSRHTARAALSLLLTALALGPVNGFAQAAVIGSAAMFRPPLMRAHAARWGSILAGWLWNEKG